MTKRISAPIVCAAASKLGARGRVGPSDRAAGQVLAPKTLRRKGPQPEHDTTRPKLAAVSPSATAKCLVTFHPSPKERPFDHRHRDGPLDPF